MNETSKFKPISDDVSWQTRRSFGFLCVADGRHGIQQYIATEVRLHSDTAGATDSSAVSPPREGDELLTILLWPKLTTY